MAKTEALKTFKLLLVELVALSFLCNLKILWAQNHTWRKAISNVMVCLLACKLRT